MRLFLTTKALQDYVQIDRMKFMDAVAENAASKTVHYYICKRTLEWWRNAIDKAEKGGDKYVRLADMLTKIEEENE